MAEQTSPVRGDAPAEARLQTSNRGRRMASARMQPSGEAVHRATHAAMRASACRRNAARTGDAKPKAKRAKRVRNLGGRLAAAIRMARLRACRAAEEHRGARR